MFVVSSFFTCSQVFTNLSGMFICSFTYSLKENVYCVVVEKSSFCDSVSLFFPHSKCYRFCLLVGNCFNKFFGRSIQFFTLKFLTFRHFVSLIMDFFVRLFNEQLSLVVVLHELWIDRIIQILFLKFRELFKFFSFRWLFDFLFNRQFSDLHYFL